MTTIDRPSGKTTVSSSSSIIIGEGFITCVQPLQDYIPPNPSSVVFWVDAGEMEHNGATVRSIDDTMSRRSSPGPGLMLRQRNVTSPDTVSVSNDPSVAATVPTDAIYALNWQNGRRVLALGTQSVGILGSWGPFAASGDWTVGFFIKMDRLVNDYNGVAGVGPLTLLSCPAAGWLIYIPSGGSVPSGAVRSAGGPLDGIAAGVPWDVAFLSQWRFLCVRNDSTRTGLRTVFLDGWPVGTTAASNGPVPQGSPFTLMAGCPASVAETKPLLCVQKQWFAERPLFGTMLCRMKVFGIP